MDGVDECEGEVGGEEAEGVLSVSGSTVSADPDDDPDASRTVLEATPPAVDTEGIGARRKLMDSLVPITLGLGLPSSSTATSNLLMSRPASMTALRRAM